MAASTKKSVIDATNGTEPKLYDFGSVPGEKAEKTTDKTKNEPIAQESIYTAAELANAHRTFGTSYAIVATALKIAGKDKATIKEAKAIVEEFKNQEVK